MFVDAQWRRLGGIVVLYDVYAPNGVSSEVRGKHKNL